MIKLAFDHKIVIQYVLALKAFEFRKEAKNLTWADDQMRKQWLLNEADNIEEALQAFKTVHNERKPYSRKKPAVLPWDLKGKC